MKAKLKTKIFVDILMTLGLLFVSGYQFWGEAPHEWQVQECVSEKRVCIFRLQ